MPAAPYAREVRRGRPVDVIARVEGDWVVADLAQERPVRGLEVRVRGNLVRLPKDLRIETSSDGIGWTTRFDERPGGLVLLAALAEPLVMPVRVDLQDVSARYVRINTGAFGTAALTFFGP